MDTMEPELPLGDPEAGGLAESRLEHLTAVVGGDSRLAARLVIGFPSLAAVYSASEGDLRRVVGPVAAARLRWFLDAPLRAALAPATRVVPRRAA